MGQTPGTVPSPTERATEVMEGVGRGIGILLVGTRQRFQQTSAYIREAAEKATSSEPSTQPEQAQRKKVEPAATQRAEAIVDDLGQRIGDFTASVNLFLRRTTARVREEAEDIWVEAQIDNPPQK
jgi:isopropylmalate/homocitrate/citramalate synthase